MVPAEITTIASLVLCCTVSIPFICYCGYTLYSHWDEQYLVKRHRSTITAYCCLVGVKFIFVALYAIAVLLSVPSHITNPIASWLLNTVTLLFVMVSTTRLWLLFYDYNFEEVLSSKPFAIVLNIKEFESNWFLRNKHTLGEGRFLLKWCIFPVLILRIISFIPVLMARSIEFERARSVDGTVTLSLIVACCLFAGAIWSKCMFVYSLSKTLYSSL